MQRLGDWIQTYSGVKFYPLDPKPSEIFICDIAHALSHLCRFTGHCRQFYSVAQHSVLVSWYCNIEDALWGLLHDAPEAYIGDLAKPTKCNPGLGEQWRLVERRLQLAICGAFDLEHEEPASVIDADRLLLCTEARDLMCPVHPDWPDPTPVLPIQIVPASPGEATVPSPASKRAYGPIQIVPASPGEAKAMFLNRYHEIVGRRVA